MKGANRNFLGDRSQFWCWRVQGDTPVPSSDLCNLGQVFQGKCSYNVYVKNNRLWQQSAVLYPSSVENKLSLLTHKRWRLPKWNVTKFVENESVYKQRLAYKSSNPQDSVRCLNESNDNSEQKWFCHCLSFPKILSTHKITKFWVQTLPRDKFSFSVKMVVNLAHLGFSVIICEVYGWSGSL